MSSIAASKKYSHNMHMAIGTMYCMYCMQVRKPRSSCVVYKVVVVIQLVVKVSFRKNWERQCPSESKFLHN